MECGKNIVIIHDMEYAGEQRRSFDRLFVLTLRHLSIRHVVFKHQKKASDLGFMKTALAHQDPRTSCGMAAPIGAMHRADIVEHRRHSQIVHGRFRQADHLAEQHGKT